MTAAGGRRAVLDETTLSILFVLVFSFILFTFRLGSPDLYDYDEGMNAEIAREMTVSGDWVDPYFNGVPYLQKPPLIYWTTALSYRSFGASVWPGRLPITLFGLIGVLALFSLVRLWGDSRAALFAGLSLATAFGYFLYSRIIMMDIPLTSFFIITVLAVSIGVRDSKRGFLSAGLAAAGMGFAVMTKGLIGVVLPLFTIAIFWMLARERWSIGKWHWAIGILIFSAIVLPWHLAMNAMHSDFLDYYILKGQLFRYLSGSESLDVEPLSVIPFLVMALVWFFPWVLFLPQAIISAVRDLRRGASDRDLIVLAAVMAVVVIGFFGSSRARLEYYSIPAMPAFAILIGRWWSRESLPSRGMGNGFIAMILVAVIGACLLLTYSEINPSIIRKYYAVIDENYRNSLAVKHLDTEPTLIPALDDLFSSMVSVIVVFFSSGLVGLWAQAKGRRRDAFAAVILSAVVLLVNIHRGLVVFEPYRSVAPLARQVATLAGKEDIVAVTGPYERASPLAFYTGRRVTVVNGFQGDLDYGRVRDPSSALYFLDSSGFSEVWRSDQRVFLITDASPLSIVESSSLLKPVYRMGRQPGRILVSNMP